MRSEKKHLSIGLVTLVIICAPMFLFLTELCACDIDHEFTVQKTSCGCSEIPASTSSSGCCSCVLCGADPSPAIPTSHLILVGTDRISQLEPDVTFHGSLIDHPLTFDRRMPVCFESDVERNMPSVHIESTILRI